MTTLPRSLLSAVAVAVAVTACALGVSMAHAQSHDHRGGGHRDNHRGDQRQDYRGQQRHQAQPHRPDHRAGPGYRPVGPQYQNQARPPVYRPGHPGFQGQRGAGPNHDWYRGARMPAAYRTHHYVVNDWRSHRLSAPPRGYYWVQNGADYLMVAIATGVIAQIILSH